MLQLLSSASFTSIKILPSADISPTLVHAAARAAASESDRLFRYRLLKHRKQMAEEHVPAASIARQIAHVYELESAEHHERQSTTGHTYRDDCKFLVPFHLADFVLCRDGLQCNINRAVDGGESCCNWHGGRWQCPSNQPHMCANGNLRL